MFSSKNRKINLTEELKGIFPEKKVIQSNHRGNSKVFSSGEKIIKYLPKKYLKPYLEIYDLLKKRTDIKLSKLLDIKKSEVLESYIVVMEKSRDDLLIDVWEDFSIEKQELILKKMTLLLKRINSVSLNPKDVLKSLVLFSRDLSWKGEIKGFCFAKLNEYEEKGFIRKSLHDSLLFILNKNIDYITDIDYVLLHNDLHFRNLLINQNLDLTLLFDFETFSIGDKYLDLVIAGSFLKKRYQKIFFDFYGKPENFEEISKVYRLIMSINFLKIVNIEDEKEVIRFIEKGSPFFEFKLKNT